MGLSLGSLAYPVVAADELRLAKLVGCEAHVQEGVIGFAVETDTQSGPAAFGEVEPGKERLPEVDADRGGKFVDFLFQFVENALAVAAVAYAKILSTWFASQRRRNMVRVLMVCAIRWGLMKPSQSISCPSRTDSLSSSKTTKCPPSSMLTKTSLAEFEPRSIIAIFSIYAILLGLLPTDKY